MKGLTDAQYIGDNIKDEKSCQPLNSVLFFRLLFNNTYEETRTQIHICCVLFSLQWLRFNVCNQIVYVLWYYKTYLQIIQQKR
jgi:hypothetical protein